MIYHRHNLTEFNYLKSVIWPDRVKNEEVSHRVKEKKEYPAHNMIYLLTAIGLSPGGRSTVHIYTQTIHRTIQNKQYIEQHNNFGRETTILEET